MPIARASMPIVTPGISHDDARLPPREHGRIRRLQPRSECGSAVTLTVDQSGAYGQCQTQPSGKSGFRAMCASMSLLGLIERPVEFASRLEANKPASANCDKTGV